MLEIYIYFRRSKVEEEIIPSEATSVVMSYDPAYQEQGYTEYTYYDPNNVAQAQTYYPQDQSGIIVYNYLLTIYYLTLLKVLVDL